MALLACPSGFSASPTGACIMVTTDRTTHWDCAALCGANASLACISSAKDNEFVASLVPSNPGDVPYLHHELWLGGYKASDGGGYRAESDASYGYKCASGQPMNYTAWSIADREPNDRRSNINGLSSDCAKILVHGADGYPNGAWAVGPCADGRRCVCEYGPGPSEEYVATINADTQLTPMVTAVWVTLGVVVPLIWLFPPLALLVGTGIYSLSTKRAAPASAAESAAVDEHDRRRREHLRRRPRHASRRRRATSEREEASRVLRKHVARALRPRRRGRAKALSATHRSPRSRDERRGSQGVCGQHEAGRAAHRGGQRGDQRDAGEAVRLPGKMLPHPLAILAPPP